MKRLLVLFLMLAVSGISSPVQADQNDPRLDELFNRLRDASAPGEASETEAEIWMIWHETPDQDAETLLQTGIDALRTGDHEGALMAFDRVVEVAPEFAEGWNKRATVHYLMGNFGRSLADISATLALEPRHFGALSGRGLVYINLNDLERALTAFDEVLDLSPQMVAPRANAEAIRRILKGREI